MEVIGMVAEAAPIVETASDTIATEAAPSETVVTAAPEAVETAPVVPVEPTPLTLADFSEDEIVADARFKEALRRETQSINDRAQHEQAKAIETRQRQWIATDQYADALTQAIDPTTGELDVRKAKAVVLNLQTAADIDAAATAHELLRAKLPAGYAIPVADQDRLDKARTLDERLAIDYEIAVKAGVAARETVLRREIAAQLRTEQQEAAKTAELRAAEAARNALPTPTTGIPAGAGTGWASQRQIDSAVVAYSNGQRGAGALSPEEYRVLTEDGTYRRLPR